MIIRASLLVSLAMLKLLASVLLPGAAFAIKGHYYKACMVPALGLLWVAGFTLTRTIVEPIGFLAMNVGLLAIHLVAIIYASRLSANPQKPHLLLTLLALCALHLSIAVGGHVNKATIFGFELYRIPSPSMTPTLAIGDIILVDTWSKRSLNNSDIVVFKRDANSIVLVKRLTQLSEDSNEMYVLGDNPRQSSDSRQFGWVTTEFVQGRVTASLFNIRNESSNNNRYPKAL